MTTKKQTQEREEARQFLRERIKPGDTVYTQLLHASRSGMSRTIAPIIIDKECEPWNAFGYVARAIGMPADRERGGVKIGGVGMDAGFAMVYELSYALYPEYDCVGEKCNSSDHVNPGECRNNTRHKDGYALRQRWL